MAVADVYQWTGEQGQVHFSDRPLQSDAERLQLRPAPQLKSLSGDRAQRERKRQRLLHIYQEERQERRLEAQKRKQARLSNQKKCEQARSYQARLERSSAIYEKNEKGERHYLDQRERERLMQRNQAVIEQYCGKP